MLRELFLENFVIIRQAHLEFRRGLTVFTGETGAGKSLLVKAVKLLMGERQSPGLLYPGAKRAVLQGVFEPPGPLTERLQDEGFSVEADGLIIRRVFFEDSRSKVYLNGQLVTLSQLKAITEGMISIAGQHEYHGLLRATTYIDWIDGFGGLWPLRERLGRAYKDLRGLEAKKNQLERELRDSERTKELLQAELKEIEEVGPREGEEEELLAEIEVVRASSTLKELSEGVYQDLYGKRGSCEELLSRSIGALQKMAEIDSRVSELLSRLENTLTELREVAYEVRDYHHGLSGDPSRLDELGGRLNAIRRLLLRHGPTIGDCLRKREELKERLNALKAPGALVSELEREIEEKGRELVELAQLLSEKRIEAASKLTELVNKELTGLFVSGGEFKIEVSRPEHPSPEDVLVDGMDKVTFLFRPNPGLPPRPLSQIASGGELSRVMLALRIATSGKGHTSTILFDEIDAGIGGETANLVGDKLHRLGRLMQVLCVSHFPQVASRADTHFVVRKHTDGASTWTEIIEVKGEERVEEISRMLGGAIDKEATGFARRLLGLEEDS